MNQLSAGQMAVLIHKHHQNGDILNAPHGWCSHREFGLYCPGQNWGKTLIRTLWGLHKKLHPDKIANEAPEIQHACGTALSIIEDTQETLLSREKVRRGGKEDGPWDLPQFGPSNSARNR